MARRLEPAPRPVNAPGHPTSPALSNLAAFRLDVRLAGLARAFGGTYTRYADDLAFSGGAALDAAASDFVPIVGAIVLEEGFGVRWRKTRVMRSGGRQELAGIVINQRPNLRRRDVDRLEAILVNCARRGPRGQNRDRLPDFRAHLEGRVGWVRMVNPARGEKLAALLAAIDWGAAGA